MYIFHCLQSKALKLPFFCSITDPKNSHNTATSENIDAKKNVFIADFFLTAGGHTPFHKLPAFTAFSKNIFSVVMTLS